MVAPLWRAVAHCNSASDDIFLGWFFVIDDRRLASFSTAFPNRIFSPTDSVAVSIAHEVVARYEALFRAAAFHPGEITTAGLAALNLYKGEGNLSKNDSAVIAKIEGHVLTVMALVGGALKLFRCVELEDVTEDHVLGVLQPTFAYMEDELAAPGSRLVLCGFAPGALSGWKPAETLSGHLGAPGPYNAGLLGYLEGARA